MDKTTWKVQDKEITLFASDIPDAPLIILNGAEGEIKDVKGINLAAIGNLDWNHDLAPWDAPAAFKGGEAFTGGADDYLKLLSGEIFPAIKEKINGTPPFTGIAGYSLAGLFAIYSLYKTDIFDRCASMSGSLWFPGFIDFAKNNTPLKVPEKLYLSLGDKESKVRNPLLSSVETNTTIIADHFGKLGTDTVFEHNPGNHFTDIPARIFKGISQIS